VLKATDRGSGKGSYARLQDRLTGTKGKSASAHGPRILDHATASGEHRNQDFIRRGWPPRPSRLQGEPPEQILRTSNTHRIAAQADSSAAPTTGGRNWFMHDPGLNPPDDTPFPDSLRREQKRGNQATEPLRVLSLRDCGSERLPRKALPSALVRAAVSGLSRGCICPRAITRLGRFGLRLTVPRRPREQRAVGRGTAASCRGAHVPRRSYAPRAGVPRAAPRVDLVVSSGSTATGTRAAIDSCGTSGRPGFDLWVQEALAERSEAKRCVLARTRTLDATALCKPLQAERASARL
jgi:hypothetical protein